MVDLPISDPTSAEYASIYMLDPFLVRLLSLGNEKNVPWERSMSQREVNLHKEQMQ